MRRAVVVAWAASLAALTPAGAQRLDESPRRHAPPASLTPGAGAAAQDAFRPVGRPWQRPLASLVVPGSGQLLAGQSRGLIYLAVEAWALARAMTLHRAGRNDARQYRALAFDVARRQFTSERRDGPFEYYETMEKYVESGVFDGDPGPAFVPEADPRTFNGSVWLLARSTFFLDPDSIPPADSPEYLAAIAFYRQRAITDAFRWSWRNAQLEQNVFISYIRASDRAFQQRTNYLGVLVVNHVASFMDALVSARLGRRRQLAPRLSVADAAGTLVVLSWSAPF